MKKTWLLLMVTCFISIYCMDGGWFSFLFGVGGVRSGDVENPTSQTKPDEGVEDLCRMATNLYFNSEHSVGRAYVMQHLPRHIQRSSRRSTLEDIFSHLRDSQGSDESGSQSPAFSEHSDSAEVVSAKTALHEMVMSAVEESFEDKEKESDAYRHAMLSSKLKLRLAIITAATTGITTIASSTVAVIIALKA